MAFHPLSTFTAARTMQGGVIGLFGAPVTLFTPVEGAVAMQGYEDRFDFNQSTVQCFIDFNPKRRVFYHFNWFPEDETQVTMGYFPLDTAIAVDCFLRTTVINQVSPYGDLLFRVVKILDDGKYQPLKRTVAMTAISDSQMYERFKVVAP